MLGNQIPPHNDDVEQRLLSLMLHSKTAIAKVFERNIIGEYFYTEKHERIFDTMKSMYSANVSIDYLTLTEELNKRHILDSVGGSSYILSMDRAYIASARIEDYIDILEDKYVKRRLIKSTYGIWNRAYNDAHTGDELISAAEKDIFDISLSRHVNTYKHIDILAQETLELIDKVKSGEVCLDGVPSGYTALDHVLNGFHKSDYIIVAARPSMGKTAFALNVVMNACKLKRRIAFFSLEMSSEQLMLRLLSQSTKINSSAIRQGDIDDKEYASIQNALGHLSAYSLFIDDTAMLGITELRAKCRRLKLENDVEMIVIDYIQLMQVSKKENRQNEVSELSRSLKLLAKELNIPIVVLAQLNRGVESRTDKRPMLSDLRESGSLEQDADVVLFIHRPEKYGVLEYDDNMPTAGTAEIVIGKHRNGAIGAIRLQYVAEYTLFNNIDGALLPKEEITEEKLF